MDPWMWWLIAAVVLIVIAGVLFAQRAKVKREADERARIDAGRLREAASAGETTAADREARARGAQQEAEAARLEADRLEEQARAATGEARTHRDAVTETYQQADEIDPDAK